MGCDVTMTVIIVIMLPFYIQQNMFQMQQQETIFEFVVCLRCVDLWTTAHSKRAAPFKS